MTRSEQILADRLDAVPAASPATCGHGVADRGGRHERILTGLPAARGWIASDTPMSVLPEDERPLGGTLRLPSWPDLETESAPPACREVLD